MWHHVNVRSPDQPKGHCRGVAGCVVMMQEELVVSSVKHLPKVGPLPSNVFFEPSEYSTVVV